MNDAPKGAVAPRRLSQAALFTGAWLSSGYMPPTPVVQSLSSTPTTSGAEILISVYPPGRNPGAVPPTPPSGDSVSHAQFRYQSLPSSGATPDPNA